METPNDRCELVLQAECSSGFSQGKPSILDHFQHPERFVEIEEQPGRNRVVSGGSFTVTGAALCVIDTPTVAGSGG